MIRYFRFKKNNKQSQYHSLLGHSKAILAPISSPFVSISQNSVRSGSQRVSEFPQWWVTEESRAFPSVTDCPDPSAFLFRSCQTSLIVVGMTRDECQSAEWDRRWGGGKADPHCSDVKWWLIIGKRQTLPSKGDPDVTFWCSPSVPSS